MENKYNEEIEKLMLKIDALAYRIGTKTDHDIFANYSSHINTLEIEIRKYGWTFGLDAREKSELIEIDLGRPTAIKKLQETIKVLEKLELEKD
ncbi:MAG: hypothetical protein HFJ48_06280 [Clostridia bacterium]|nr:hypothetical protein [Clostridia bacterium]